MPASPACSTDWRAMRSPSSPTRPGTTRDVLRQHVQLRRPAVAPDRHRRPARRPPMWSRPRACAAPAAKSPRPIVCSTCWMPRRDAARLGRGTRAIAAGHSGTLVFNKIDLDRPAAAPRRRRQPPRIFLSAHTGAGLTLLRAHLKAKRGLSTIPSPGPSPPGAGIWTRWAARGGMCKRPPTSCAARGRSNCSPRICGSRSARSGEITGEFTSEDLLGEIFGSFCIGK